jgi:hypothetical protein
LSKVPVTDMDALTANAILLTSGATAKTGAVCAAAGTGIVGNASKHKNAARPTLFASMDARRDISKRMLISDSEAKWRPAV